NKFHLAVSSARSNISRLRSNFLPSKVVASGIEQEDLIVGTLTKALYVVTEFRLTPSFVRLNEILCLDGKSIGDQVLPCRQGHVGSEKQAAGNRHSYHSPKRQKYFPEQSPH